METENPWVVVNSYQFVDKRSRLTREHGLVHQNVRAWRGRMVRKGEDGKPEYANCVCAHQKASSARKCAEREARRRNRADQ